jgi:hypothetical protein
MNGGIGHLPFIGGSNLKELKKFALVSESQTADAYRARTGALSRSAADSFERHREYLRKNESSRFWSTGFSAESREYFVGNRRPIAKPAALIQWAVLSTEHSLNFVAKPRFDQRQHLTIVSKALSFLLGDVAGSTRTGRKTSECG